jgi:hypothetical protein
MIDVPQVALLAMRLVLFGLSLGLTVISFQAYSQQRSDRLQSAFIGFAFISMGVAVTNLTTQISVNGSIGQQLVYFQMAETVPFIVGFAMIYLSLYR